jgi:hypothetical protein
MMISRNEVSRKPEVRLYSYIPVIKEETAGTVAPSEAGENESTSQTNALTAKLSL